MRKAPWLEIPSFKRSDHEHIYPLDLQKIAFTTPAPQPAEEFDLNSTDPKLYRPFRHGANYITMGIRRLDWSNWIEMDSNFLRYHDLKVSELNKDLAAHVKYVDNEVTRAACFEVYEELAQFLTKRYPKIFKFKGTKLHNTATGEVFQYPACEYLFHDHRF